MVVAAVLVSTTAFAPTASAADRLCETTSKVFARGGSTKASRTVHVKLCVERDGEALKATGQLSMGPKTGSADIVYHFTLNVRLERYDDDYAVMSCSGESWVNFDDAGGVRFTCQTETRYSPVAGGWTADGNVSYDIIGDGLNNLNWSLQGSPEL
jgi:hypothetical protein